MRAGKIDRSLLKGESFELFSSAIRSPATRDPYERKLLGFLKRVNLTPDELAQIAELTKQVSEVKETVNILIAQIQMLRSDVKSKIAINKEQI